MPLPVPLTGRVTNAFLCSSASAPLTLSSPSIDQRRCLQEGDRYIFLVEENRLPLREALVSRTDSHGMKQSGEQAPDQDEEEGKRN